MVACRESLYAGGPVVPRVVRQLGAEGIEPTRSLKKSRLSVIWGRCYSMYCRRLMTVQRAAVSEVNNMKSGLFVHLTWCLYRATEILWWDFRTTLKESRAAIKCFLCTGQVPPSAVSWGFMWVLASSLIILSTCYNLLISPPPRHADGLLWWF